MGETVGGGKGATMACAEVDLMLRRHHEQLIQHLDRWMIQLEQTICIGAAKPAFPPARDSSPERIRPPAKGAPEVSAPSVAVCQQEHPRGMTDAKVPAPSAPSAAVPTTTYRSASFLSALGTRTRRSALGSLTRKSRHQSKLSEKLWELRQPTRGWEPPDPQAWNWRIGKMVNSFWFELFATFAIFLNAACVGAETQHAASYLGASPPPEFMVIQYCFAFVFLVELVLRLIAYQRRFFTSEDWQWNWFDFFLVVISLLDVGAGAMQMSGNDLFTAEANQGNASMSIFRLLRVARIGRTLRIVRILRFVVELRSLFLTIIRTLKSLVWSLTLLCIQFYCFGVMFTQAATDYVVFDAGPVALEEDPGCASDVCAVQRYFGGIGRSMFTLFKSITSGISWAEVTDPLGNVGWPWVALFVVYIAFTVFAVLNVVTSKFCQSAIDSSLHDHVALIQNHVANKQAYLGIIKEIFSDLDSDGNGTITLAEFEENLGRDEMRSYLDSVGLSSSDALVLFSLLDADETQTIDVEEFMMGCLRLRGNAKSIDLASLMSDQRALGRKVAGVSELVKAVSKEQQLVLAYVRGLVQPQFPGDFSNANHLHTHVL